MEQSQQVGWTDASNDRIPHHRLHKLGDDTQGGRKTSLLLRKMETESGKGIVVRELWPAGEAKPQEFSSDGELVAAMESQGLPLISNLESVRRSIAATRLPSFGARA